MKNTPKNYIKLKKYVERNPIGAHMIVYAELKRDYGGEQYLSNHSDNLILCRIVRLDEDCEGVYVEVLCPIPFETYVPFSSFPHEVLS